MFIHNKLYQRYGSIDAQEGLKTKSGVSFKNAIFYAPVEVGKRCIINAGAVIGEQGFKIMKNLKGNNERLIHIGGVKIGNEVEIGANTCIDKGTYGNTEINDYVKIDNFVRLFNELNEDVSSVVNSEMPENFEILFPKIFPSNKIISGVTRRNLHLFPRIQVL